MKKKKICLVMKNFESYGGRVTFVNNMLEVFRAEEFQVNIISKNSLNAKNNLDFIFKSFKFIIANEFNMLLGIGPSSVGAVIASKIKNTISIINLSDTHKRYNKYKRTSNLNNLKTLFLEFICYSVCDMITLPSNTARTHLLLDYRFIPKNKVKVIKESPDFKNFPKTKKNEGGYKKVVLFPRVTNRKNLEFFSNVVPYLTERKIHVIFFGYKEQLDRKFTYLKDSKYVIFLDDLTLKDIRLVYTLCDLMIYIPKDESHSYTILEALYYNLPVLISNIGWLKDNFFDYDLKINKFKIEEIINKIDNFYSRKTTFKKVIKDKSRKLLKEYNFDNMRKQYLVIFENEFKKK